MSFYVGFAAPTHTCLLVRAGMVYAIDLLYVYMFVVLHCFRHVHITAFVMHYVFTNMWALCSNGSEQLWFIYPQESLICIDVLFCELQGCTPFHHVFQCILLLMSFNVCAQQDGLFNEFEVE